MTDAELTRRLEQEADEAPQDKLEFVREQVRQMRDLERRIEDIEALSKELRGQRRQMEMETLPELFMNLGINSLGLDAEGNMPAYDARLLPHYAAKISAEWPMEQQQEALDWLRKNKLGDLIKTIITIELGLGTATVLRRIEALLGKLKIPYRKEESVHHMTLTKFIRDRYGDGKPLGTQDLRVLGATVGHVVKLKPKKEK